MDVGGNPFSGLPPTTPTQPLCQAARVCTDSAPWSAKLDRTAWCSPSNSSRALPPAVTLVKNASVILPALSRHSPPFGPRARWSAGGFCRTYRVEWLAFFAGHSGVPALSPPPGDRAGASVAVLEALEVAPLRGLSWPSAKGKSGQEPDYVRSACSRTSPPRRQPAFHVKKWIST